MQSKKEVRKNLREKLADHDPAERKKRSLAIAEKLIALPAFKQARTIALYVSMPTEVDTEFVIDKALSMGKRVAVPLCNLKTVELGLYEIRNRQELEKGTLGIYEPKADKKKEIRPEEFDLVIVPGVAYDDKRNRLGQGRGYYDKFLAKLPKSTYKIGLAFSFQVVPVVPVEPHDVRLDMVLTD